MSEKLDEGELDKGFNFLRFVSDDPLEPCDWKQYLSELDRGEAVIRDGEKIDGSSGGRPDTVDIDSRVDKVILSGNSSPQNSFGGIRRNPYELLGLGEITEKFDAGYTINLIGQKKSISEIESVDGEKLVTIEVRVEHMTDTSPVVVWTEWQCAECGSVIEMEQNVLNEYIEEPDICPSCENTSFYENESERMRADRRQAMVRDLDAFGSNAEKMLVHLFHPDHRRTTQAGERVEITGIVKHLDNDDGTSDREFIAVYMESKDRTEISISKEQKEELHKLAQRPDFEEVLVDSFAPHIYGWENVKRGLIYSVVSGQAPTENINGLSHCLMMGDPGTAKSKLMEHLNDLLEKSMIADGSNSTGVGLTATYDQNEKTGEKVAKPGPIVHMDGGVLFVDEMDKFRDDDLQRLNRALSEGQFNYNKNGVNATFKTETVFVGAANPIYGKFDPQSSYEDQFDFPPDVISRMDQVFIMEKSDENAYEKSLSQVGQLEETQNPPLDQDEMRRLLQYARSRTIEYSDEMQRTAAERGAELNKEMDASDMRSNEGIHRLAVASARLHFRDEVIEEDIEIATELVAASDGEIGSEQSKYTGLTEERVAAEQEIEYVVSQVIEAPENATKERILDEVTSSEENEISEETAERALESLLQKGRLADYGDQIEMTTNRGEMYAD